MGKYGMAAEIAAQLIAKENPISPREAWDLSVIQVFPDSLSSRNKGCPRDSFLALCGIGVVKDVQSGVYTRSIKNKIYVERALYAIRENPALAMDEKILWKIATNSVKKKPNHQMDVLITLFVKKYIE